MEGVYCNKVWNVHEKHLFLTLFYLPQKLRRHLPNFTAVPTEITQGQAEPRPGSPAWSTSRCSPYTQMFCSLGSLPWMALLLCRNSMLLNCDKLEGFLFRKPKQKPKSPSKQTNKIPVVPLATNCSLQFTTGLAYRTNQTEESLSCMFVLRRLICWILHYYYSYYYTAHTVHSLGLELCALGRRTMYFEILLQMESLKTALNPLEVGAIIPESPKRA